MKLWLCRSNVYNASNSKRFRSDARKRERRSGLEKNEMEHEME